MLSIKCAVILSETGNGTIKTGLINGLINFTKNAC